MAAAEAAKAVRKAMKSAGVDPKGNVRVRNLPYETLLEVDLRGIYGEALWAIEAAIDEIDDDGSFSWEVESWG